MVNFLNQQSQGIPPTGCSCFFFGFFSPNRMKGFTLLELMVVMVFISVLAAISIPVFQRQVGKAREAEVQLKLGAIARSQMAYHYVNGSFADTLSVLAADTGAISSFYYNFPDPTGDSNKVKHQAVAKEPTLYQLRDYAIGLYYVDGAYVRANCQGFGIGDPVNVGDLPNDPCTNNGIQLQ
jgi:type IV pilus assembly protein PilA